MLTAAKMVVNVGVIKPSSNPNPSFSALAANLSCMRSSSDTSPCAKVAAACVVVVVAAVAAVDGLVTQERAGCPPAGSNLPSSPHLYSEVAAVLAEA